MLSWSFVTQRIKEELSLPFQELEYSDEKIKDYLQRNALVKYSRFFPQTWRYTFNTEDENIHVLGRDSEFYLVEPDDREIFNIKAFYPSGGTNLMLGHSIMGAWSYGGDLKEVLLANYQANNLRPFSQFNHTFEFITPNQFRITPKYSGVGVLEYERSHDPELSTIKTDHHDIFIDLCFGMIGMNIGRLRKRYQNIQTPFGEIPINGDDIFNDAKEVYDRTIEKLEAGSLLNVIFDYG